MRFVLLSFYVYHPMYYPYVGDSMADHGTFLVGFHKAATSFHAKLNIAMPPVIRPEPLASFMHKPFNSKEYAVSLARHHPEFLDIFSYIGTGFSRSKSCACRGSSFDPETRKIVTKNRVLMSTTGLSMA